jgi:hypothetical protein
MWCQGPASIIFAMTHAAHSSKVVLLEDRRGGPAVPGGASVRRYRLARLRFDGYAGPDSKRFEYLKRTHD